jgi:hypothetical protein
MTTMCGRLVILSLMADGGGETQFFGGPFRYRSPVNGTDNTASVCPT